jgi:catechol-2,3-dioxygenase
MAQPMFQLDHLNLPAKAPEELAQWYAETFGLTADAHRVRGPGVLIVFQRGAPVDRAPDFHLGLRMPSMQALKQQCEKFKQTISPGPEFSSFRLLDPEGNCIEVYARSDS